MKLIDIATRRRATILMFTVAVQLFGFVSLSRLPVNLLPDLSYPTLIVRTEYPGAAPAEIENLISRPIEEAVGVVRGVRIVRSVSRAGQSDVTLEFSWGTHMDYAALDVREKLEVLQLPLEAERPMLLRFDPSTEPVLRLALSRRREPLPARAERPQGIARIFAGGGQSNAASTQRPRVPAMLPTVDAGRYEEELKVLRRYSDEQLKKAEDGADVPGWQGQSAIRLATEDPPTPSRGRWRHGRSSLRSSRCRRIVTSRALAGLRRRTRREDKGRSFDMR